MVINMGDKVGDILMFDVGSEDAKMLQMMNYTPYIFDSNKRVLFAVDSKGIKLYKKLKKHIAKLEGKK